MKSTGIVRRTDDLGRIVIPKELRRTLRINEGDPLEIFTDGNYVMLRKYEPTCIFCSNSKDLTDLNGKKICHECLKVLAQKFKDISKDSVWRELKWKNMKLLTS